MLYVLKYSTWFIETQLLRRRNTYHYIDVSCLSHFNNFMYYVYRYFALYFFLFRDSNGASVAWNKIEKNSEKNNQSEYE